MSTPLMERLSPNLRSLKKEDILKDNPITLQLDYTKADSFFGLLELLLITDLGAHDLQGIQLMKEMFPKLSGKSNSQSNKEEKKPSIGIKIDIELESEGFRPFSNQ